MCATSALVEDRKTRRRVRRHPTTREPRMPLRAGSAAPLPTVLCTPVRPATPLLLRRASNLLLQFFQISTKFKSSGGSGCSPGEKTWYAGNVAKCPVVPAIVSDPGFKTARLGGKWCGGRRRWFQGSLGAAAGGGFHGSRNHQSRAYSLARTLSVARSAGRPRYRTARRRSGRRIHCHPIRGVWPEARGRSWNLHAESSAGWNHHGSGNAVYAGSQARRGDESEASG